MIVRDAAFTKGDNRWSLSLLLFRDASSEQPHAEKKNNTLLVIQMANIRKSNIRKYTFIHRSRKQLVLVKTILKYNQGKNQNKVCSGLDNSYCAQFQTLPPRAPHAPPPHSTHHACSTLLLHIFCERHSHPSKTSL